MPSNDEQVRDVPPFETFINTLSEGTNISPFTLKNVSCKLFEVSNKITSHKWSLIGNVNYLVKAMNKFAKGSINVEKHKLESREKMITLLIESNKNLVIKQMEFEFENWKFKLESCA